MDDGDGGGGFEGMQKLKLITIRNFEFNFSAASVVPNSQTADSTRIQGDQSGRFSTIWATFERHFGKN